MQFGKHYKEVLANTDAHMPANNFSLEPHCREQKAN